MKILGVAGTKNTGKTTLVTLIVSELVKRGYQVGTIKHTHHDLDMEGKDTWKHRKAGAELVVGSSEESTTFIMGGRMDLEKILKSIRYLMELDFVIIEGFKFANYPKISTTPQVKDKYTIETVDVFNLKDEDIIPLVDLVEERTYGLISGMDCCECGYQDCLEMAQAIVKGEISEKECKMKKFDDVQLFIDDENIPLNPFVQDILKESIMGMLSTLKTGDNGIKGKVELLIRNEPK